jgi:cell division control protein 6
MKTPPPKTASVGVKRSLQFSSSDREGRKPSVSSRLQFPESPLKSPERPKKISTPTTVALARNPALPVYQGISKNLNPSHTTEIVGREREIADIRNFLNEKIDTQSGGSLYVSGGPGTGKTACLTLILKEIGLGDSIFVNCISKPTPLALLKEIASRLGVKTGLADVSELLRGIERRTSGKRDNVVVVLDEIDALASKFQENLYSLFSMPAKRDSKLVLIGVANALDLTTRVLPHLKWLAPETRPVLIHFKPYSKFQLGQIISKRIGQDGGKVLPPLVVQYVAGKVANLNGDCRRALDVCRVCVDRKMAVKRKQLVLATKASSEDKENGSGSCVEAPQACEAVSLPEVAKVFSEGVGMGLATSASPQTNEGALPLLQKLALLALWASMSKAKKDPVVSLAKVR